MRVVETRSRDKRSFLNQSSSNATLAPAFPYPSKNHTSEANPTVRENHIDLDVTATPTHEMFDIKETSTSFNDNQNDNQSANIDNAPTTATRPADNKVLEPPDELKLSLASVGAPTRKAGIGSVAQFASNTTTALQHTALSFVVSQRTITEKPNVVRTSSVVMNTVVTDDGIMDLNSKSIQGDNELGKIASFPHSDFGTTSSLRLEYSLIIIL